MNTLGEMSLGELRIVQLSFGPLSFRRVVAVPEVFRRPVVDSEKRVSAVVSGGRAAALEGLAYVISYKAGDHVLQPARGWASSLASHSLVSNSPSPEIEARKRSNPSVELSQREMESEDRPERRRRKKGSS